MRLNFFTPLATALVLASGTHATYVLAVFWDKNCTTPVNGTGQTEVLSGTCDSNVKGGFNSAQVLHKWNSPAGTITYYSNDFCAGGFGSYEISFINPGYDTCHDFGFTAHAVSLLG
ncbi:hypothetical protein F5Y16DRAFT_402423 [Xylariaceae sp. FL0255]|nr:hypothetical protein F5Y16DRAFT_402423 [Xylariaceae sp. FL0255]